MKTVSVVMCTYNGAKYLREQLDSIISQTYPIYELIIQDDCSTDDTVAIVKEYMEKYSFIKLYINEHNLGFNLNFKSACMKATGDYVAISDQDDVWFPAKIEKQVESIGNCNICCSSFTRGETISDAEVTSQDVNFERLLFFNPVSGHTMLCQRCFIQDESNWIKSIWYDWSLALQASLKNGIAKVEQPLNWHRRHLNEASRLENHQKMLKYQPYIMGLKKYRELQKNGNRRFIYTYLYNHTKDERFHLVHQFCKLLLKEDFFSLINLCLLCQKNRDAIYFYKTKGIMGWIRGFFFPLFHACTPTQLYNDFS